MHSRGKGLYGCKTKRYLGAKACNGREIKQSVLDAYITNDYFKKQLQWIKVFHISPLQGIIEKLKLDMIEQDNTVALEKLNNEVGEVTSKIDNLLDLASEGMAKDRFKVKMDNLEIQRKLLTDKIIELTKSSEEIKFEIIEIEDIIQKIKNQEIKKEYTRKELIQAISKIIVNDANGEYHIKIRYKITDKLMKYVGKYKDEVEISLNSNMYTLYVEGGIRFKEVKLIC